MNFLRSCFAVLLVLAFCNSAFASGALTTNGFIYKPNVGDRGTVGKSLYDAGMDRVDARLGKTIWVGDPNYPTFAAAVATLNAAGVDCTLVVPAGNHPVTANLTVNSNISLKILNGAGIQVSTTKTLTHNGFLEAGLYKIFFCTGTGKVMFGPGAIKEVYPEWWAGTLIGTATDASAACQAALTSLSPGQTVQLQAGTYTFAAGTLYSAGLFSGNFNIVWPEVGGLSFKGKGKGVTKISCPFGSATDKYRIIAVDAAAPRAAIHGVNISGFTLYGPGDIAAVPVTGVYTGVNLFDVVIDDIEVKWFRGSGVRSSGSPHAIGYTVSNCYFHDLFTAAMPNSLYQASDGGAIQASAYNLKLVDNRIVNVGAGCTEVGLYHAVYSSGCDNVIVSRNYAEGAFADLSVGSGGTIYNRVVVSDNITNGDDIIVLDYNNATISGNVVNEGSLSLYAGLTNFTCTGNSVYTPTLAKAQLLYIYNASNGVVSGNNLYGIGSGTQSGITIADTTTGVSNIVISNNNINHVPIGIFLLVGSIKDITITNNRFKGLGSGVAGEALYLYRTDIDNIIFDSNYVECFKYMIETNSTTTTSTNIFARNNIMKDVLMQIEFNLNPSGPFYLDNNMAVDTVLAYNYGTAEPSATTKAYINNTWRLPDTKTSTLASSPTPSVAFGKQFKTGGTTTITNLTKGTMGQTITILSAHTVTVTNNANANPGYILLSGGANFAMVAGDTLTLHMFEQGVWQEVSRKH